MGKLESVSILLPSKEDKSASFWLRKGAQEVQMSCVQLPVCTHYALTPKEPPEESPPQKNEEPK